ncbi:hypothetical protein [Janibacter alittae]|uniref:Uncharacterized protein n=1 Tax=Janibacter alittae TaxID=3115209 RepID=A0ABZ2MIP4_9MICO
MSTQRGHQVITDDDVEGLGEPTGLVRWSAGTAHASAVSARSQTVHAVASYEPVTGTLMDQELREFVDDVLCPSRAR